MSSVSPSVYLSYTKLRATMAGRQTYSVVGGVHNTMIAYPPDIILTQSCNPRLQLSAGGELEKSFKAMNYTAFQQETSFCSARAYPSAGRMDIWSSKKYPFVLSFPPGLSLVDPKWKTCSSFEYGALDPPSTLEKATAMVDPGQRVKPSSTAAPAAGIRPAHISATATPDPPTSTPKRGDTVTQKNPPAAVSQSPEIGAPAEIEPSFEIVPPTIQQSPAANSPTENDPPKGFAASGVFASILALGTTPQVTTSPQDPKDGGNPVEGTLQGTVSIGGLVQDPDVPLDFTSTSPDSKVIGTPVTHRSHQVSI